MKTIAKTIVTQYGEFLNYDNLVRIGIEINWDDAEPDENGIVTPDYEMIGTDTGGNRIPICIDIEFEIVECWLNGTTHDDPEVMADYGDLFEEKPDANQRRLGAFAIKQYKAYKLAAGKMAKSILISCSTRLAPFAIDEVLEITSYDELHLDKLGDELSALFIIISDTDATFNFLVAIMYSQGHL